MKMNGPAGCFATRQNILTAYPSDSVDSGVNNGVEIVPVRGEGVIDVENYTWRLASVDSAVRILSLDGSCHVAAAMEVDHRW